LTSETRSSGARSPTSTPESVVERWRRASACWRCLFPGAGLRDRCVTPRRGRARKHANADGQPCFAIAVRLNIDALRYNVWADGFLRLEPNDQKLGAVKRAVTLYAPSVPPNRGRSGRGAIEESFVRRASVRWAACRPARRLSFGYFPSRPRRMSASDKERLAGRW